ncbi:MAG: DM13 domain-containing protein, partial [Nitrososphaerales archaeon]
MKKIIVLPIIAAIAVIAVYYASPLFINATVNEPAPTAAEIMGKETGMMEKDKTMMEEEEGMTEKDKEAMMEEHEAMEKEHEMMMEKQEPSTTLTGNFVGAGDGIHNAEGVARILAVNDGNMEHRVLRLENFKSTNGPDLYVYLSKDPRSIDDGYIQLARLKGNIGNQNYDIPDDVNLEEYS